MVDQVTLDTRKKDTPSIDQVTTILWTPEMGRRLALVRMKMLKEQKEIAREFGVTQSTISRIEIGHLKVSEQITVAAVRKLFGTHFSFIVYGTNPERYNASVITKVYWDTRLRARRKNKSPYSRSRIL